MTVTMEGQRVGSRFDVQQAEGGGEATALTSQSQRVAAPIEVPFVRAPDPASYGAKTPKAKIEIKNIDQLKAMTSAELEQLFENGRAPDPARFKGEMRGIALAAPYHDNTKLGRFVNWVMTKIPPWLGKNAMSAPGDGQEGQGKNRIFGGLFCPFEWNVVESRFDSMEGKGAKVIRLDYGTPKSVLNSMTGINCVHDELREVGAPGSGVYLGVAGLTDNSSFWTPVFNKLLQLAGRKEQITKDGEPVPIIFFALQAN